jgi:hypothetical protein
MGLSDSKPVLTAEDRALRETAKANLVGRRKAEIENAQKQYVNSYENKNALVDVKEIATFFKVTEGQASTKSFR